MEIERKIREVNDLVVNSHDSFRQVHDGLRQVQDVVPLTSGDGVSIEAVPGRIFDMLAKAQITLGSVTGARIPLNRHGEGTQSLSVLMLFTAFLEAWPAGALTDHPSSVIVCERANGESRFERLDGTRLKAWLDKYSLGELWSSGELGGNRW